MQKFTCPCCGYKILSEKQRGSHELCPVCFWEDDGTQFDDPKLNGGANLVSLKQAQQNYIEFGASEKRFLQNVRKPTSDEVKDPNWQAL